MSGAPSWPSSHLELLASAAKARPDVDFLRVADARFSYAQSWEQVQRVGRGLIALGIEPGDRVLVMLENRPEALWTWLGTNCAAAIDVPVSTEAVGALLAHFLRETSPKAIVASPEALQRISAVVEYLPEVVVVVGGEAESSLGTGIRHLTFDGLLQAGDPTAELLPWEPGRPASIIFTSGTTGPSKGVVLPHGALVSSAEANRLMIGNTQGSVVYTTQPLCHIDPRGIALGVAAVGGTLVLGLRFSATRFWAELEEHDVDVFVYIGTMLHLLDKQPEVPSGLVARHRWGLGSSTPAALHQSFSERFNVQLFEGYGMSELPVIMVQGPRDAVPGNVGRPLPYITVRLVDSTGQEVPEGEPGELLVRPDRPHIMMAGYWNRPEATLQAWADLWFHTGDIMRRLPGGTFEFIGRMTDSIRRRGENVSAWEVEETAARHEGVREAAAIGVPSQLGGEDVALLVVPLGGFRDATMLLQSMAADLPRYALPRFVEFVDALPKTGSERVAKAEVRKRGITSAAYDAEDQAVTRSDGAPAPAV